jgi:hypothetical protein
MRRKTSTERRISWYVDISPEPSWSNLLEARGIGKYEGRRRADEIWSASPPRPLNFRLGSPAACSNGCRWRGHSLSTPIFS